MNDTAGEIKVHFLNKDTQNDRTFRIRSNKTQKHEGTKSPKKITLCLGVIAPPINRDSKQLALDFSSNPDLGFRILGGVNG